MESKSQINIILGAGRVSIMAEERKMKTIFFFFFTRLIERTMNTPREPVYLNNFQLLFIFE